MNKLLLGIGTVQSKEGKYHSEVGRGRGQVVSVRAFYFDDLSSNPAEAYRVSCLTLCLQITKINKKEAGVGPFYKKIITVQRKLRGV